MLHLKSSLPQSRALNLTWQYRCYCGLFAILDYYKNYRAAAQPIAMLLKNFLKCG